MRKYYFLVAVFLAGVILRAPFTSLAPVVNGVANAFDVSFASLGMVTTLPLLAFSLFSPTAPWLARRVGVKNVVMIMASLLVVGSALRLCNVVFFFVGTFVVGIALAYLNVLLPSIIRFFKPADTGRLTAVYVFGMMSAMTGGAALSVQFGWSRWVIILTVVALVVAVAWVPKFLPQPQSTVAAACSRPNGQRVPTWTNPRAWLMLLLNGIQSVMFYIWIAWAPTMAMQNGLSNTQAGRLAAIAIIIALPFALVVPPLIAKATRWQRLVFMVVFAVCSIIAYLMMLHTQSSYIFWLVANVLAGLSLAGLFPYVMMMMQIKTTTSYETAQLAAMVQCGGNVIAAAGPYLFGLGYACWHAWWPQSLVVALLLVVMIGIGYCIENSRHIFDEDDLASPLSMKKGEK